jgi:hypothetical protein
VKARRSASVIPGSCSDQGAAGSGIRDPVWRRIQEPMRAGVVLEGGDHPATTGPRPAPRGAVTVTRSACPARVALHILALAGTPAGSELRQPGAGVALKDKSGPALACVLLLLSS